MKNLFNINSALLFMFLIVGQSAFAKKSICSLKDHKTTLYFGSFKKFPTVDFCVLYDGEVVDVEDESFSIKDQMLSKLNVIFVDPEKISFSTEENTVINLKLTTKNYECFELNATQFPTPNSVNNNFTSSWKIRKKTLNDTIPLNSIVVPLSPKNINIKLQNVTWKPNNLAVSLPTIKLTPKKGEVLKDLMVEGYLKSISLQPFHAKQKIKSIVRNAMKVSMII